MEDAAAWLGRIFIQALIVGGLSGIIYALGVTGQRYFDYIGKHLHPVLQKFEQDGGLPQVIAGFASLAAIAAAAYYLYDRQSFRIGFIILSAAIGGLGGAVGSAIAYGFVARFLPWAVPAIGFAALCIYTASQALVLIYLIIRFLFASITMG
ncbi:MAG: hypothetical protein AAGB16_05285 [Pseudomonadota bacterium]